MKYPHWVLLFDTVLMASFAYVLAHFAVRAFAKLAGFRQLNSPVSQPLTVLGWSLAAFVGSDLAENIFTLLSFWLYRINWPLYYLSAGLMSLASLGKYLALAATVALILWAWVARRPAETDLKG